MSEPLFRQKSLERISSPEELHDYMRVTSPRLWMILSAVVILLAGFIIYASTTTMENTMEIKVNVDSVDLNEGLEGEEPDMRTFVTASLPLTMKDVVQPGMVVRIGQETGKVDYMGMDTESDTTYLMFNMDKGYIPLKDGEYTAQLVLESTTPISFLWN